MEIRKLNQEEIEDSLRLSEFAFQYTLSDEDFQKKKKTSDPNQTWGSFVDGKLAAKIYVHPLHIWIQGEKYAMGGVASVSTWPEYRRQGLISKLIVKVLEEMKDAGQTLSFLHPFSIGLYRKFGWELINDFKQYELRSDQLPLGNRVKELNWLKENGKVVRVENNWQVLNDVYEQYARQFNGMLDRSEQWWQSGVFDRRKTNIASVYYNDEGQARGYVQYEVQDQLMTVIEFIALDEEAYGGLWNFIANHDSMINRLIVSKVPVSDPLPFLLPDPNITIKHQPYFMGRIVDVESFLEKYTFRSNTASKILNIRVYDHYAPWNEGVFTIEISQDGRVQKLTRKQLDAECEPCLNMSVGLLTAIMLGYVRPAELYKYKKIDGCQTQMQHLEQALPVAETFFNDMF